MFDEGDTYLNAAPDVRLLGSPKISDLAKKCYVSFSTKLRFFNLLIWVIAFSVCKENLSEIKYWHDFTTYQV